MAHARWGGPRSGPATARRAAVGRVREAAPEPAPGAPGRVRALVAAGGPRAERLAGVLTRGGMAPVHRFVDGPEALAKALAEGPWDVLLVDSVARDREAAARAVGLAAAHDASLAVIVTGASGEAEAVRHLAAGARDALVGGSVVRLAEVVARELGVARLRRDWARVRDAEGRLARERRRMGRALASAREAERHRIARDLHDEMGQAVTAIRMEAAVLARALRRAPAAAGAAERIERAAAALLSHLKGRLDDLAPPDLRAEGLVSALRSRVAAWQREAGVPCTLSVFGPVDGLKGPVPLAAYRVVQEALTNAARHAGASRVRVRVGRLPGTLGRDDLLEVSVADDGRGLAGATGGGRGLAGLRERVRALEGELTVSAGPARGTRVTARLPIHEGGPARARGA